MLIKNPVFLVGSERSGTTLLRLMLDHHPIMAFNLESEYMVTQISDDDVFPEMKAYSEFLSCDRVFKHSNFEVKANCNYIELLNDFLMQKKNREGKEIVGATVHYQFKKLSLIWPHAKYIYLFRDGRDVANSVVGMGWAGNTFKAADNWLDAEDEWSEVRNKLNNEQWMEVQYEQLTYDPEHELERICRFIGVEYSERMFDYIDKYKYKYPSPTFNYQWKTKLSKEEIQRLEARAGSYLIRRGYELSDFPSISISNIEKGLLTLDSRVKVFLFAIKRYGITLIILEKITRKLRIKFVHSRIKSKMDHVISKSLR